MANKIYNSRIVNKHDTEANWLKAVNFIPLQGELIVYDVDENYTTERLKVGDGQTLVSALPFISGESVDITIDDELSTTSTNAVQNKVITTELSAVFALVGDTSVSDQISTSIADKADVTAGQYVATAESEDGVAFTATVPSVAELTAGVSFIIVPARASSTKAPTLDVNGLGAKNVKRRLSSGSTAYEGFVNTWLTKNKPFRLIYDGAQWIVEGHSKPVAADIYGDITATYDINGNSIVDTYAVKPKITTIALEAASWVGDTEPYSQIVTISVATANSKIDLQPTATQIISLQETETALMAENDNGTVTVYALGTKPMVDYSMQAMITEVVVV